MLPLLDWLANSGRFKYTLSSAFRSLRQASFLWHTGPSLSHSLRAAIPAHPHWLNVHVHAMSQIPHLCLGACSQAPGAVPGPHSPSLGLTGVT